MVLPTTKKELNSVINSYLNESNGSELTIGHIIAHKRAKSNKEFCEYLKCFYGDKWSDSLKSASLAIGNKYSRDVNTKANNIHRKGVPEEILKYLNGKFTLPVAGSRKRPVSDNTTIDPPVSAPETPPPTPQDATPPSPFDHRIFITPKRSKPCGQSCLDVRHESSSLRKELSSSKAKAKRLQTETEKLRARINVKFQNEPRVLNQTIKRSQHQIIKLRNKLSATRAKARQDIRELRINLNSEKAKAKQVQLLETKVENLQDQVRKLKDQKAQVKKYHSTKNSDSAMSKKLKNAESLIKSLKEKLSGAENRVLELEEGLSDSIKTMDGKQFDEKTRMCINYCLEKNVSLQNASGIVEFIVHEMTGKTLEKLPAPSTNANIQREFGIISDIQCGAILSESSNVTLAWDGTTKDGVHYNEKHVVTASGPLTLGVTEMPGGKAVDYRRDLRNSLTDITNRYSQCFNTDPTDTSKKIHDGKKIAMKPKLIK